MYIGSVTSLSLTKFVTEPLRKDRTYSGACTRYGLMRILKVSGNSMKSGHRQVPLQVLTFRTLRYATHVNKRPPACSSPTRYSKPAALLTLLVAAQYITKNTWYGTNYKINPLKPVYCGFVCSRFFRTNCFYGRPGKGCRIIPHSCL